MGEEDEGSRPNGAPAARPAARGQEEGEGGGQAARRLEPADGLRWRWQGKDCGSDGGCKGDDCKGWSTPGEAEQDGLFP